MNKVGLAAFCLALALLLLFSAQARISYALSNPTYYPNPTYYVSETWGYSNSQTISGYPNEGMYGCLVCSYIDTFVGDMGSAPLYETYWVPVDNYYYPGYTSDYSEPYYVEAYLRASGDPSMYVAFAMNWWVGDYTQSSVGNDAHFGLATYEGDIGLGGNYADNVWDSDVYNYAVDNGYGQSVQNFDFIWTCMNGAIQWDTSGNRNPINGLINGSTETTSNQEPTFAPSPSPNTQYSYLFSDGCAGMPAAWTGDFNLAPVGQDETYCYIGFQDHSPWMSDYSPVWGASLMYNFPMYFYEYATGYNTGGDPMSISESLDYASNMVWGVNYNLSPLAIGYWDWIPGQSGMYSAWWFNYMNVFGDQNCVFPSVPAE